MLELFERNGFLSLAGGRLEKLVDQLRGLAIMEISPTFSDELNALTRMAKPLQPLAGQKQGRECFWKN